MEDSKYSFHGHGVGLDVEVPSHSDSFGNESYDVTGESFNAGTDCMEDVAGLDL